MIALIHTTEAFPEIEKKKKKKMIKEISYRKKKKKNLLCFKACKDLFSFWKDTPLACLTCVSLIQIRIAFFLFIHFPKALKTISEENRCFTNIMIISNFHFLPLFHSSSFLPDCQFRFAFIFWVRRINFNSYLGIQNILNILFFTEILT